MSIVALVVSTAEISEEHAIKLSEAIEFMKGVIGVEWVEADGDYYASKMNARHELIEELRPKLKEVQECLYGY